MDGLFLISDELTDRLKTHIIGGQHKGILHKMGPLNYVVSWASGIICLCFLSLHQPVHLPQGVKAFLQYVFVLSAVLIKMFLCATAVCKILIVTCLRGAPGCTTHGLAAWWEQGHAESWEEETEPVRRALAPPPSFPWDRSQPKSIIKTLSQLCPTLVQHLRRCE